MLTESFLDKKDVYFVPQSSEESTAIQSKLFVLGCYWIKSKAEIIDNGTSLICVSKRIMTNGNPKEKAIFCTIMNFSASVPTENLPAQRMRTRLQNTLMH